MTVLRLFASPRAPKPCPALSTMPMNLRWQFGQIIETSDPPFTANVNEKTREILESSVGLVFAFYTR